MGIRHPPPLNDITRLDVTRKLIGIGAVAILVLTFVPQPFVAISSERALVFRNLNGLAESEIGTTIVRGTSITVTFALNNTGPTREQVVVTAIESNLEAGGFVFRFTGYTIGSNRTPVDTNATELGLNATQGAVFDLNVTAPVSWPAPSIVSFAVRASTLDASVAAKDLTVTLHVTP